MALDLILDNVDGLSAEIAGNYVQGEDGKFRLAVNGADDLASLKSALVKERKLKDDAEKQKKEFESLAKKFEGVDLDDYYKQKESRQKQEEEKLLVAGDVEKVVEQRLEKMRTDLNGQIKKLTDEKVEKEAAYQQLQSTYNTFVLDTEIRKAVDAVATPTKNAMFDIIGRVKNEFKFVLNEQGIPTRYDNNGAVVLGKTGSPETVEEAIKSLTETHSYYFLESKGGGSTGSRVSVEGRLPKGVLENMTPAEKLKFALANNKQESSGW